MRVNNEISAQQQGEQYAREQERVHAANDKHKPRKLTFAQNVILTIKILAVAGFVLTALWGLSLWTSTN